MTLAKYNTKNGSPNNRRKVKRALEREFIEIRNMESSMDTKLKDAYLNNLAFLQEELWGNEAL
tara:strand:+ start:345 stop:533 length:189 start_codon:yes stop_codon:yes gene_type:complete